MSAFLDVELSEATGFILAILASLVVVMIIKVLFHASPLAGHMPESGLVIVLGVGCGGILYAVGLESILSENSLSVDLIVFSVLLPLIVFPDSYTLDTRTFFLKWELALVLLHALVGTIINTLLTGTFLWLASPVFLLPLPLMDAFIFGSLISATDPIAVLAIFEEVHVNERLSILVNGESVLNDAAGITLYGFFLGLKAELGPDELVDAGIVFQAIAQFLVIAIGGACWGVLFGGLASIATRFTGVLSTVEPLLILGTAWISYLIADCNHSFIIL